MAVGSSCCCSRRRGSGSNLEGFSCRLAYVGNVGGMTSSGRCHSFLVLAVLEYFMEQDQAGRTGRNYNICFDRSKISNCECGIYLYGNEDSGGEGKLLQGELPLEGHLSKSDFHDKTGMSDEGKRGK